MIKFNYKNILSLLILISLSFKPINAAEKNEILKVDWSFKGLTGKFDRASLQRGFSSLQRGLFFLSFNAIS